MGIKISELPQASQLTSDDVVPIVQSGETKKVSISNVITNSNNSNQTNTYSSDYINNNFNKVNVQTSQTTSTTDTYSCNYIDNKIKNEYNTSTTEGYSSNYINNKIEGLNTYSTTEQRIGTWMGKPLYRKAKIITSKSSSDLYTEALVNVDEVTNMYGMAYFGSRGQPIPRVLTDGNANYALGLGDIDIAPTGIVFRFQMGSSYSNFTKATIIIEYTKTTD